jgi:ubiquinone/menaquinone biosynthesis C-methylase UbiE
MTEVRRSPLLAPRAGYDAVAESYDDWEWQPFWTHNERPLIKDLIESGPQPRLAIDLGVGTGRYLSLLQQMNPIEAIGIDISGQMLNVARRKTRSTRLLHADVLHLPVKSAVMDLAIAARTLCHVAELDEAMREIARTLRPSGVLIVTELDPDHAFSATKVPVAGREVFISTWKRTPDEIVTSAAHAGLEATSFKRVRAPECQWLPPSPALSSIDRTGQRPIFLIGAFQKR